LTDDNITSATYISLTFLVEQSKTLFINHLHIPPIIFKHQLYSLRSNNRTSVDCDLQKMFETNHIRIFHSDFGPLLMFSNDYRILIDQQTSSSIEIDKVKQHFINDLLPHCIRLSIDRTMLENDYNFNSKEIQLLIQLGLILPKNLNQYWFSIPNIARFITCIDKGRRTLLNMLNRRTYREIPMNEFRLRDTKKNVYSVSIFILMI